MISTDYIANKIDNQIEKNNIAEKAAVLVPITQDSNGQLVLLFQIRAPQLKWQPGDICFPGGKMEIKDKSPIDTAIRETHEELGITKKSIKIYGQLSPFLSTIGFKIYPVVGELTSLDFNLNQNEVAETFTVPINWFINNPPIKAIMEVGHKPADDFPFELVPQRSKDWQKRSQHDVFFYHYQKYTIWGLTAQVVQLFLNAIR